MAVNDIVTTGFMLAAVEDVVEVPDDVPVGVLGEVVLTAVELWKQCQHLPALVAVRLAISAAPLSVTCPISVFPAGGFASVVCTYEVCLRPVTCFPLRCAHRVITAKEISIL